MIYSLGLRDMVTARDIGMSYGFPKNTLSRAIHSLEKRGSSRDGATPPTSAASF